MLLLLSSPYFPALLPRYSFELQRPHRCLHDILHCHHILDSFLWTLRSAMHLWSSIHSPGHILTAVRPSAKNELSTRQRRTLWTCTSACRLTVAWRGANVWNQGTISTMVATINTIQIKTSLTNTCSSTATTTGRNFSSCLPMLKWTWRLGPCRRTRAATIMTAKIDETMIVN